MTTLFDTPPEEAQASASQQKAQPPMQEAPAPAKGTQPIALDLTFEEGLRELEGIVRRMEEGQVPLEESIQLYERGAQLKSFCQKKLEDARLRIEKVSVSAEGEVKTEAVAAESLGR